MPKPNTKVVGETIWEQTPRGHEDKRKANKKINLRSVSETLAARGLDPIESICDVLPQLEPSMQARTLLSLAEFVHPKLGRTEVTGAGGGAVQHAVKFEVVGVLPKD